MIPINIQCRCGHRYAFELDPAHGDKCVGVSCPGCGADGSLAASEIIAKSLPSTPVASPPPIPPLSLDGEPPSIPPRLPTAELGVSSQRPTNSPLWTIWTRPRETVRRIIWQNPELYVVLFACLAGIAKFLDRAAGRSAGDSMPMGVILGLSVSLGPVGGLFALWLYSHLVRWSGAWLGGKSSRELIRTAIAWASVPLVFSLPLWAIELPLFGSELFTSETPRLDSHPALFAVFIGFAAVEAILGIWAIVLACHTIAEVQGFRSAWRGLGNILLAGVVLIVPVMILILMFTFLARLSRP